MWPNLQQRGSAYFFIPATRGTLCSWLHENFSSWFLVRIRERGKAVWGGDFYSLYFSNHLKHKQNKSWEVIIVHVRRVTFVFNFFFWNLTVAYTVYKTGTLPTLQLQPLTFAFFFFLQLHFLHSGLVHLDHTQDFTSDFNNPLLSSAGMTPQDVKD